MGYALARAARRRGHDVILVSGPVDLPPPPGVRTVAVISAEQMAAAARRAFSRCDGAIFAAAVCDYRPRRAARRKRAKSARPFALSLAPTHDIAAELGRAKGRRVAVAFALEDHAGRAHAERKLRRKNCDAIILNTPAAIGADRAAVEVLVTGQSWQRWPADSKPRIAERIVALLERLAHPAGSERERAASVNPAARRGTQVDERRGLPPAGWTNSVSAAGINPAARRRSVRAVSRTGENTVRASKMTPACGAAAPRLRSPAAPASPAPGSA